MPVIPKDLYDRAMQEMRDTIRDNKPPHARSPFQAYFGDQQVIKQQPFKPEPEIDIEAEDDKLTS